MQSEKVASHTERKNKIMRTKTMLLSALLGTLGSVSLLAQGSTNVYSLNVVGYVNETIPAGDFAIISCPLMSTPDNTLNTLLPNSTGTYFKDKVYLFSPATGYKTIVGGKTSWGTDASTGGDAGTNTLSPGQAAFFDNTSASALTLTFVGSVVSGPTTNSMVGPAGTFNLVSSVVPVSGDLVTNTLSALPIGNFKDKIFIYTPGPTGFQTIVAGKTGAWGSDPTLSYVGQGFFYQNNSATAINWTENFSVSTP